MKCASVGWGPDRVVCGSGGSAPSSKGGLWGPLLSHRRLFERCHKVDASWDLLLAAFILFTRISSGLLQGLPRGPSMINIDSVVSAFSTL